MAPPGGALADAPPSSGLPIFLASVQGPRLVNQPFFARQPRLAPLIGRLITAIKASRAIRHISRANNAFKRGGAGWLPTICINALDISAARPRNDQWPRGSFCIFTFPPVASVPRGIHFRSGGGFNAREFFGSAGERGPRRMGLTYKGGSTIRKVPKKIWKRPTF